MAAQAPTFAGREFQDVERFLHFAAGFGQQFAFLQVKGRGHFFQTLLQKMHGFEKQLAAPGGGGVAPALKGFMGGFDGLFGLLAADQEYGSQRFAGGRIDVL